jgi:hypothetical protein
MEAMRISRRGLLQLACLAPRLRSAAPVSFPSAPPNDRAVFPQPRNGETVAINPPGFAWWRAPGAAMYRLLIWDDQGREVYQAPYLTDPVHLPTRPLPPGEYSWDVEACDRDDRVLAKRGVWYFTVPEGVTEFPWIAPEQILALVPDSHPRYMFLRDALPEIRRSLQAGRRQAWNSIRSSAERYLKTEPPKPPEYHTYTDPARQRMGYVAYFREFRSVIDNAMSTLALAYVLSGDERYGLAAKRILLEVESWGIEGPMSVMAPWGDEPGLSMAKHGHRAYDWLYDLFDESERQRVRDMTIGRARQVLTRLKRADYLASPGESHNGRLIAYLSEYAVTLKDEAPDAVEWLDYSLRALTTFYPHWGDSDGGWAEGISYALSYNLIYLGALESLLAATGYNLYQRPFYQRVRRFLLYCTSPVAEIKPFGDGFEGGVGSSGATLMMHHGRRFRDPACVWYARQTGASVTGDPLIALLTEDDVPALPPSDLPSAAVFRGVGWAAMHSALDKPREDTLILFKSSPYGSVSHSHADQNSFAILKGGRGLAIPSGYYGPAYGMPHHAQWTRQTKAHNSILVNGEGQVWGSAKAQGRILDFRHQRAITYVAGDAAAAYQGKLKQFVRHLIFLRPALVAVLDELEAPAPAEFRWLLHAFEPMELDEAARLVIIYRAGATLSVRLACDHGLAFSQTDQFDTPYNEGNPPEYHEDKPNQWHFTARTLQPAARTRIGAVMVVRGPGEDFDTEWLEHPGWWGVQLSSREGAGRIWIQVTPDSRPPEGVPAGSLLAARWQPPEGDPELMLVGASGI